MVALRDGRLCGHALTEPMSLEAVRHVFRLTVVVHPGYTGQEDEYDSEAFEADSEEPNGPLQILGQAT